MKVLSLWQPWASLVTLGVKTIETRSWSTKYRGPLAIHAAARGPVPVETGQYHISITATGPWLWRGWGWTADSTEPIGWALPLGAIVATCTLVDVVPIVGLGEETAVRRIEVGTAAGQPNLMLCAPDPVLVSAEAGELSLSYDAEAGVDFDASDYYERHVSDQGPYGLFEPGRYAWLLADIVPVDPPVPFKGGQGLTKTWEPVAA